MGNKCGKWGRRRVCERALSLWRREAAREGVRGCRTGLGSAGMEFGSAGQSSGVPGRGLAVLHGVQGCRAMFGGAEMGAGHRKGWVQRSLRQ